MLHARRFVMTLQSYTKTFENLNSTKHKSCGIITLIDKTLSDDGAEALYKMLALDDK